MNVLSAVMGTPPPLPPKPPPLPGLLPHTPPVTQRPDEDIPAAAMSRFREEVLEILYLARDGTERAIIAVIVIGMILTVVLIPVVLYYYFIKGVRESQKFRRLLRPTIEPWLDRAVVRMGYPVMVTSHLRRPGSDAATGLILVCLDEEPPTNLMIDVVGDITHPPADVHPEDRAALRRLMTDEQYTFRRWRKVPESVGRGKALYVLDMAIHPFMLAGHHLTDDCPFIPMVIDPTPGGLAMVLPYWTLTGQKPTSEENDSLMLILGLLAEAHKKAA